MATQGWIQAKVGPDYDNTTSAGLNLPRTWALGFLQQRLAEADALRGGFHQLVVLDVFQGLSRVTSWGA